MKKFSNDPADELIYELALRELEPDFPVEPDDEPGVPLQFPAAGTLEGLREIVQTVDWRPRAIRRFAEHLVRRSLSTPSA